MMEMVASLCMEEQPGAENTEDIISMDTGVLCPGGSKYASNDINTFVVQAEVTSSFLTHHKNMFMQDEQQLQKGVKVVVETYNFVQDSDMFEFSTVSSRIDGPGIASKMR